MPTSISVMCVLMLLVVNVSGKKYIVETEEDDLNLSNKNDKQFSRGFLRIKRKLVLFLIQITAFGIKSIKMLCLKRVLKGKFQPVGSKREISLRKGV